MSGGHRGPASLLREIQRTGAESSYSPALGVIPPFGRLGRDLDLRLPIPVQQRCPPAPVIGPRDRQSDPQPLLFRGDRPLRLLGRLRKQAHTDIYPDRPPPCFALRLAQTGAAREEPVYVRRRQPPRKRKNRHSFGITQSSGQLDSRSQIPILSVSMLRSNSRRSARLRPAKSELEWSYLCDSRGPRSIRRPTLAPWAPWPRRGLKGAR